MVSPQTPPQGYPTSPSGRPCGTDWNVGFTVTGKLNGIDFGSQFREQLDPIMTRLPSLSWNQAEERGEVEDLRWRINVLRDTVAFQLSSGNLRPADAESISVLLEKAETYLEAMQTIYERWDNRPEGSWPLSKGDLLKDFDDRCGGFGAPLGGHFGTRRCPTEGETAKRKVDRTRIANLFLGALQHVQCARYLTARLKLYNQAYRAFREQAFTPGGFGAEPPVPDPTTPGVGGLVTEERPRDPSEGPTPKPAAEPLPGQSQEFDPQGLFPPVEAFPWPGLPQPPDQTESPEEAAEAAGEGAGSSLMDTKTKTVAIVAGSALLGFLVLKVLRR